MTEPSSDYALPSTEGQWDKSDADLCRERGWGPGTRIVGDEGYGPTVLEITAVGEKRLLAKVISHNGDERHARAESAWVLQCRDWAADSGSSKADRE